MKLRDVPRAILVALGLTPVAEVACISVCLSLGSGATEGFTSQSDFTSSSATGTGSSGSTTASTACLSTTGWPPTTGPCLSPPLTTGSTGGTGSTGSTGDTDSTSDTGSTSGTDSSGGSSGTTGGVLGQVAGDMSEGSVAASRAAAIDKLAASDALPADVIARLRGGAR